MSQILQTVYASAPSNNIPYHTLELKHPVLPGGSIRWVQGFEDQTFGLENGGGEVLFEAVPFAASLPAKNDSGNQKLQFQVDNVTSDIYYYMRSVIDHGQKIEVIYRVYLDSNKSSPAEHPVRMVATVASGDYKTVQIVADFHDLLNSKFPTFRYTADFAPGLKYI